MILFSIFMLVWVIFIQIIVSTSISGKVIEKSYTPLSIDIRDNIQVFNPERFEIQVLVHNSIYTYEITQQQYINTLVGDKIILRCANKHNPKHCVVK